MKSNSMKISTDTYDKPEFKKTSTNYLFSNPNDNNTNHTNYFETNTHSSNKFLTTNYKSQSLNLKKFNSKNFQTNSSRSGNNFGNTKYPVSTYISCSTLQSGIACYSIPKQERFENSYKKNYCDSIYNLPELSKKNLVSIGNSKRKEIVTKDKKNIPSSQDYFFTSIFEDNLTKHKGFSLSSKLFYKVKYFF